MKQGGIQEGETLLFLLSPIQNLLEHRTQKVEGAVPLADRYATIFNGCSLSSRGHNWGTCIPPPPAAPATATCTKFVVRQIHYRQSCH